MKSQIKLAITGNPGVGKHTTVKFVSEKLGGVKIIRYLTYINQSTVVLALLQHIQI